MLDHECPEAVLPDRELHLPTFSHLLIVNKLLSSPSGPCHYSRRDVNRVFWRYLDPQDTFHTHSPRTLLLNSARVLSMCVAGSLSDQRIRRLPKARARSWSATKSPSLGCMPSALNAHMQLAMFCELKSLTTCSARRRSAATRCSGG